MFNIDRTVRRLLVGLLAGGVIHFALPFALSAQDTGAGVPSGTIGVGAVVVEPGPVHAVEGLQSTLMERVRDVQATLKNPKGAVDIAMLGPVRDGIQGHTGAIVGWVEIRHGKTVIWAGDLGH